MARVYDATTGQYYDDGTSLPSAALSPNFVFGGTGMPGKNIFKNAYANWKAGKPLFNGKVPNLHQLASNIRNTKLVNGMPSLGNMANIGMGIYQGIQGVKNIADYSSIQKETNDLKRDIREAIATNPMYSMYLDPSDKRLLRQFERGGVPGENLGGAFEGIAKGLPQTLLTTGIGALMGGPAGAAIGGIGGLANSALSGYNQGSLDSQAKLQALYSKLQQAGEDYRMMKRPSGLLGAGLQTRYFNQLY